MAGSAAELLVVHLKIRHRATTLASPAIALKGLIAKFLIKIRIEL